MVEVGTGGSKSKYIRRNYPVEEGLTAGTTKQEGKTMNLVPEESSLIPDRLKVGL